MQTVNFNIRLDSELKARTFPVIERFGLTPAQAVKLFFTQIAETDSIPLSFDYPAKTTPTARLQESIRQAETGDTHKYATFDDFLKEFGFEKP